MVIELPDPDAACGACHIRVAPFAKQVHWGRIPFHYECFVPWFGNRYARMPRLVCLEPHLYRCEG